MLANNVELVTNYTVLVGSRTRNDSHFGISITRLIGRETTSLLGGSEQEQLSYSKLDPLSFLLG